ncbi:hypothetical protein [uncultured Acinetobacter sp.]|uniref:hypothetical protein n=1 Tax=uncultured Acinetobacter sp. TaxID=165433 RepID=UPI00258DE22E|nr:hypothetical protein [uncultured Acinetobacter sp.]
MPEKKDLTVKAVAVDGTEKAFTVEFDIYDATSLDDRDVRVKSIFPNVVLINEERVELSGKTFTDPRDNKEYTLKLDF